MAVSDALEAPAPPPRKSKRNIILLVVAIAAVGGGGTYYVTHHGRESTDDAQVDAELVLVPARVDGLVKKVNFVENQHVKAGDVLAELDDSTLVAKLAQAEATLARATAVADSADATATLAQNNAQGNKSAAKASLTGAAAGAQTEAAQLGEGKAQLTSSQARLAQAQSDVDRARKLVAVGAITKAEAESAETKFRLAQADVEVARARIATLQTSVTAARSRIEEANARATQSDDVATFVRQARAQADAAKADVKVAQAQRDLAALNLSYAKILAPQDGVISKKSINVGQQLAAGQTIGQLVTEARWVTANFKETQVEGMREGQPVTVKVDAFSDVELHGSLESLSGGTGSRFALLPPDNASGNFTKVVQRVPVRIKLTSLPSGIALRPGMNVEATVDTRTN
ncbi:MAG TPA: HlyD family secretion protein [Kofleriaceae bacterium]